MLKAGICGIGASVPKRRILVEDIIKNWNNTSEEFVKNGLGVRARTVLASDEDVITLASKAANLSLKGFKIVPNNLDSIFFGTATSSELFRGCGNMLMETLTGNSNYFSSDIFSADRSGTAALITSLGNVSSGLSRYSIIIGGDVMCRHTAPGDLRESYEGAGAVSCIVGTDKLIAEIQGIQSYNSNFPEMGKPEDERFIRTLMPMEEGVLREGVVRHVSNALSMYLKKYNKTLDDFDEIILPQQYPGEVFQLSSVLQIPKEKVRNSIFSEETGDIGSASPLLALMKILENIEVHKHILLCSYGHNSGADIIGLETTDELLKHQGTIKKNFEEIFNKTIMTSYSESLKLEYKLVAPNISIGTFN